MCTAIKWICKNAFLIVSKDEIHDVNQFEIANAKNINKEIEVYSEQSFDLIKSGCHYDMLYNNDIPSIIL